MIPRLVRHPAYAFLLPLALVPGCRDANGAPAAGSSPQSVMTVRLAPVVDTLIVLPVTGSGVLGAKEEIPLGFKIGGVVQRITVHPGDQVEAGQLLASLELPEIAGAVAKAAAAQTQAERDLARAEALYRDSVIPRSGVEAARTGAAVARADLDVAHFNERYATIRSPSSGTILARYAEPGQQVAGGTPLLLLASQGEGQVVRVGLADQDVARVRRGDRATVRFGANRDAAPGRVTQVAAQASAGTGTWSVEIRLEHPERVGSGLASGLIGSVEITPARAAQVQLIPLEAILEGDGDSAQVYTLHVRGSDTVAMRRGVRIAFLTGGSAAIRAGLDGVDEVVTAGSAYLQDGGLVRRGAP